ncbi:MAG: DUF1761 domain-containing protein [Leptospirales bacterium]|nr:DUF1761 domain-containing protein [Leptospirales bacterium]
MQRINHFAVFLLTLFAQAFHLAWYALWRSAWGSGLLCSQQEVGAPGPAPFVSGILASLSISYFLAWLNLRLEIRTYSAGARLGAFLWLGLAAPILAAHYAHMQIGWWTLIVDLGRDMLLLPFSAAILAGWNAGSTRK